MKTEMKLANQTARTRVRGKTTTSLVNHIPHTLPLVVSCRLKRRFAAHQAKRAKLKNPSVDTSFLPDREREEEERRTREELRKEWLGAQEEMKKEEIEITCSYWDGSGHRMSVKVCLTAYNTNTLPCSCGSILQCKKGDDIGTFLEKCRQQIPELRGISVDNLMYIKEDLIIPHVGQLIAPTCLTH